jgi:hypothetical protein
VPGLFLLLWMLLQAAAGWAQTPEIAQQQILRVSRGESGLIGEVSGILMVGPSGEESFLTKHGAMPAGEK